MRNRTGKSVILWILVGIIGIYESAQTIIKNPGNPLNNTHGRIVRLEMFVKITDESDDYYFRRPGNLKVDSNGNIYLMDSKQLLKFNPNGKFVRNMFKPGQGPGEATFIDNYLPTTEGLMFFNSYPAKMVWLDKNGQLIKEKRIQYNGNLSFLFQHGKQLYFISKKFPLKGKDIETVDVTNRFMLFNTGGELVKNNLYSFTSRLFIARFSSGGFATSELSQFHACMNDKNSFFFVNTHDYEINRFDMVKGAVTLSFKRPYTRVKVTADAGKHVIKDRIALKGKWVSPPLPEYFDDVLRIFKNKDKLWAVTSTVKDKKILVDVFDMTGKYVDNFYLELPTGIEPYSIISVPMTISNDTLYIIEEESGKNYFIAAYKIKGV
jgi:hypothetical protein